MKKRAILLGVLVALSSSIFWLMRIVPKSTQLPINPPINVTPTYEGCYYMWASKDLPEVTVSFQARLESLYPEASGIASAYGEDCVYADGHAQFGAMETDFNLAIQVKDISDNNELGKIIEAVLPAFDQKDLPAKIGKITIQFKSGDKDRYINFDHKTLTTAFEQGLRGEELLKAIDGK